MGVSDFSGAHHGGAPPNYGCGLEVEVKQAETMLKEAEERDLRESTVQTAIDSRLAMMEEVEEELRDLHFDLLKLKMKA